MKVFFSIASKPFLYNGATLKNLNLSIFVRTTTPPHRSAAAWWSLWWAGEAVAGKMWWVRGCYCLGSRALGTHTAREDRCNQVICTNLGSSAPLAPFLDFSPEDFYFDKSVECQVMMRWRERRGVGAVMEPQGCAPECGHRGGEPFVRVSLPTAPTGPVFASHTTYSGQNIASSPPFLADLTQYYFMEAFCCLIKG